MTIQTAAVKQYFGHPQALVETEEIGPGTRIWAFAHVLPGDRIGAQCKYLRSRIHRDRRCARQ
jgi:hypothetical protein